MRAWTGPSISLQLLSIINSTIFSSLAVYDLRFFTPKPILRLLGHQNSYSWDLGLDVWRDEFVAAGTSSSFAWVSTCADTTEFKVDMTNGVLLAATGAATGVLTFLLQSPDLVASHRPRRPHSPSTSILRCTPIVTRRAHLRRPDQSSALLRAATTPARRRARPPAPRSSVASTNRTSDLDRGRGPARLLRAVKSSAFGVARICARRFLGPRICVRMCAPMGEDRRGRSVTISLCKESVRTVTPSLVGAGEQGRAEGGNKWGRRR